MTNEQFAEIITELRAIRAALQKPPSASTPSAS
jgi:hypothetical protein